MLTVVTLLKRHHAKKGEGDRDFWHTLGGEYLAKLVRAVRRYISPSRIVCLTDSPELMPEDVEPVAFTRDDPSWWSKLQMFAPGVVSGRCLYLDLDNVIAGPLDELTALTGPLVMTDDRHYPGLPNGSTMLFDAEAMRGTWDVYQATPEVIQRRYSTWPMAADQAFLAAMHPGVPLFQQRLPAGYMLNALTELNGNAWRTARLVFGCSVPKPHDSPHPFYREHWQ